MPDPDERPRGMLTKKDRALLRGEIEYEYKQQYSNRRKDIRERIANGIIDYSTIQYLLQDDDRKRIFRDPPKAAGVDEAQFHESIRSMLYWTYFGLKEQNYDFVGLLSEAVEEAEVDFARKYWGESIDVSVQFDVDVTRSRDIGDTIEAIEQGGPVKAKWLYDLLQISGGVPIDTSKLDTVRVRLDSPYPNGERAVLEAIFSEYLGVEVDVEPALGRVDLDGNEGGSTSAVVDPDRPLPDPGEIKNYRSTIADNPDDGDLDGIRRYRPSDPDDTPSENESILGKAIDDSLENSEPVAPSIRDILGDRKDSDTGHQAVTPESVLELLDKVSDQFVSTTEVAAAFGCPPEAARQALTSLYEDREVRRRSVIDNGGSELDIWWVIEE